MPGDNSSGGHCRNGTTWVLGASLIGAGVLLFLDNLGVLSVRRAWTFWPLALVGFGIAKLGGKRKSGQVNGLILIFFGLLSTANNIGLLPGKAYGASWTVSLLLILLGAGALQAVLDGGRNSVPKTTSFLPPPYGGQFSELSEWVLAGSLKRRFHYMPFHGGEVNCVLGEVILDLREATHIPGPVHVEAHAVFGSIRLRIPADWAVVTKGSGVFGAFEDNTLRVRRVEGEIPPTLVLHGGAIFGAVTVDN